MKKLAILFVFLISFVLFAGRVDAAEVYKRGIIKAGSAVKYEPNGATMKSDTNGNIILSVPEAVEIVGEKDNYYQIKYMWSGFVYVGYVPKNNVTAIEYEIDENYRQELVNKGFPLDYAHKLAILHAIHPNWTFTPSFTGRETGGMDFNAAVAGEAKYVNTNAIQTTNTSLLSTRDGAYENGVWKDVAGYNWKAASEQTIAFYMDPRNFLDESHIFMFENLAFNPGAKNRDSVLNIIKGTFMDSSFECFNGATNCVVGTHSYVDTFLEVGEAKGVSPSHLAARVKIEQGAYGSTLSLGKGWPNHFDEAGNLKYVGLYNFFNIGASGATDEQVLENGFKYAESHQWNNPYVSIFAGSNLISNNYIGRGQSTNYYQKFNTITPTYFINQYMQNVRAPYQEAYNTYTAKFLSFKKMEEWDVDYYDFLIPVYRNMGAMTSLDVTFNGDATLKSLSIPACKMNPSFMSNAYTYDCYVPKGTTSLDVLAEATNSNAKLEYPSKVTLTADEQKIEIKVTAVNGTPGIYTVNVHRIDKDLSLPEEILNKVGYKVDDNFVYNIAYQSDVSNIISSVSNSFPFATIKIQEADGTEITEGLAKTGQIVIIENAGTTKTFNISIFGDADGSGKIDIIDLLAIQKHLLGSKLLTKAHLRGSDANRDNKVDILDLLVIQKYLLGAGSIDQG